MAFFVPSWRPDVTALKENQYFVDFLLGVVAFAFALRKFKYESSPFCLQFGRTLEPGLNTHPCFLKNKRMTRCFSPSILANQKSVVMLNPFSLYLRHT